MTAIAIEISQLDTEQLASLNGPYQKNIKDLEIWFDVKCRQSGSALVLSGEKENLQKATACLNSFITHVENGDLSERKASELLMMFKNDQQLPKPEVSS